MTTVVLVALQIDNLRLNYEQEFLGYLTQPADAMQIATLFRILSTHAENEEYLDSDKPEWIQVSSKSNFTESCWRTLML